MRTIKSNSILLLILTIFTAFVAPVTQVVQAHNNNGEYVKFDETEYIEFIEYGEVISVEDYTTQSTKRISITFKDLIIGWLIDGTIEYVTGRAPSEWISWGLSTIESRIRAAGRNQIPSIYVSRDGTVNGCFTFPCMLSVGTEEQ